MRTPPACRPSRPLLVWPFRCVYELAIFTNNVIKDHAKKKEEADKKKAEQKNQIYASVWVPDLETELLRRIMILSLGWPDSLSCRKASVLDEL